MVGVDTNILVHAHRQGSEHHPAALDLVRSLSTGSVPYALFWPSLYEFVRVVTHHRVFDPPSTPVQAIQAVNDFIAPSRVLVLSETNLHQDILGQVMNETAVRGNLVHDAHLVALALEHGVHEILTLDEDFRRFPQVASRNPFR